MNTVNASLSSFVQADTTYNMEDSNSPTIPKQRKRKNDDSNLSEEEKLKKKKNRDAAKKCREKKEKEAKQLKERNAELEKENADLAKIKIQLESRIINIKNMISEHMNKGCKLPPHVQEVWDQELGSTSRMNDMKDFIEVGTMEIPNSRMHTPPHTPDSSSSGRLSPTPSTTFMETSASTPTPVSLFSGAPIQQQNMGRKNSTASRSPSASPGPTTYTGAPKEDSMLQDLSHHLLASKSIHPALAPIQVTANSHFKTSSHILPDRLSLNENYSQLQTVPTVVLDDDSEEGGEYKEDGSYTLLPTDKLIWIPVPEDSMSKAFEHPDVPSEDVISNELFKSKNFYKSDQIPNVNENLSSLGFNAPEGYSFAEDLEEPEAVQNIMNYATSAPLANSNNDRLSKIPTQISSDVSIATCAPALLSLGPDFSPTLQAQIKSFSKQNSEPAVSLLVMQSQQNVDQGQQYTLQLIPSNALQQHNMISSTTKYVNVPALSAQPLTQQRPQTFTVVSPEILKGRLSCHERDPHVVEPQLPSAEFVVIKDTPQHRIVTNHVGNNIIPMINKERRPQQISSVSQVVLSSSHQVVATPQASQTTVTRLQNPVVTSQANQAIMSQVQASAQNLPSGDFSSAVNDLPSLNFNEMDQEDIFKKTRVTKVSSS